MANRHSNNSLFRPRIAVVSPFLDKRHGTERCVAEQIERLADDYEIHLYSHSVKDVDLGRIVWHRVPVLPGPHLFSFCCWVVANHLWRWWDAHFRSLRPALTYSPGINCLDTDVISVHVVFGAYMSQSAKSLHFRANPVRFWPRLLHRRLYYALIIVLERLLYPPRKRNTLPPKSFTECEWPVLTAISAKAARNLRRYGRVESEVPVIVYGIDPQRFNPEVRQSLRSAVRQALGLKADDCALLLVGNDWRNKGLPSLLESLAHVPESSVRLLVVGTDITEPYRQTIARLGLEARVTFLPMRSDAEYYYAASDVYVGPSLNDAFGLPPLEAMACGLPVISSSQAGVSDLIHHGVDGFTLQDPHDSRELAELIALLYNNDGLRHTIGAAAAATALQYTWERNAGQLGQLFQAVLRRKGTERAEDFAQSTAPIGEGRPL